MTTSPDAAMSSDCVLSGPRVHTHPRLLLGFRLVTGVDGHVSLSSSSDDSLLSPTLGVLGSNLLLLSFCFACCSLDSSDLVERASVLACPRRTSDGGGRLRVEIEDEEDSRSM